jgi:RNA polymerase sigma factor (sigma-70 family)
MTGRNDLEGELERHHADCYGWALSCCARDRSEAEDVLQTSYLKVLDGRAKFGSRSTFKTWLFGVIRRTAAEHRRRGMLQRFWSIGALHGRPEAVDPAPDPVTALSNSESNTRLVLALAKLSQRQRDLLHLVFYQELTIEQAAEVIGISVGTARTHYERGKSRLRGMLALEEVR